MRKAETCRLYELAPTPHLFVRPITAILGKWPMVRAGNTGTIPFSMRLHERAYDPGGRCDLAVDKGDCSWLNLAVVRKHLGDEMVAEGMKMATIMFGGSLYVFTHIYM